MNVNRTEYNRYRVSKNFDVGVTLSYFFMLLSGLLLLRNLFFSNDFSTFPEELFPIYRNQYILFLFVSILFRIISIYLKDTDKFILKDVVSSIFIIIIYMNAIHVSALDSLYNIDLTGYLFGLFVCSFFYKTTRAAALLIHISGLVIFVLLDVFFLSNNNHIFDYYQLLLLFFFGLFLSFYFEHKLLESFIYKLEIEKNNQKLKEEAITDHLTGLRNRQYLNEFLEYESSLFRRDAIPFCLAMIDIDDFKKVNDSMGHDVGDLVLKRVSQTVTDSIRGTDLLIRFGGEEFILLMTNTVIADALVLCNRIREKIFNLEIAVIPWKVSASFGLAEIEENDNQDALIKRADINMYKAKRMGKNCCVASKEGCDFNSITPENKENDC